MSDTRKGGCLCGAVRFEAAIDDPHYHVCHCSTCRRWGAPGMACPVDTLSVEDTSSLRHFASSEHAERAYCADCGGHLYWRLKDQSYICVFIGAFDDSADLEFKTQLFVEQKPRHYHYGNDTEKVTGEELFAQFQS